MNQDKPALKSATWLSNQGKKIFDYLIQSIADSETPFSKIDEPQINLLAESIDQTIQAIESIHEDGLIVDGKRNQAIMIYNSSLKNVNALMTSLNLSMNQRVKLLLSNIENQSIDDPFQDVIQDE